MMSLEKYGWHFETFCNKKVNKQETSQQAIWINIKKALKNIRILWCWNFYVLMSNVRRNFNDFLTSNWRWKVNCAHWVGWYCCPTLSTCSVTHVVLFHNANLKVNWLNELLCLFSAQADTALLLHELTAKGQKSIKMWSTVHVLFSRWVWRINFVKVFL